MATARRKQGAVYRFGPPSERNCTPRAEKDTAGRPGQEPGLSTFETPPGGRRKVQKIDLALLREPLAAFADDPAEGGTPGHVAIAPVNKATGEIDYEKLREWAAFREQEGEVHEFTQIVLDSIVEEL